MAPRFDANGDDLSITASLPSIGTAFTVCFWMYRSGNGGSFACPWSIYSSANDHVYFEEDQGSGQFELWVKDTVEVSMFAISNATWYFIACVRDGTSFTAYWATLGTSTLSSGSGTQSGVTFTPNNMRMGDSSYGSEWWNGRVCNTLLWEDAALTQAELTSQMYITRPHRTEDLYGWWPMLPGAAERLRDYSGNGHDWTAGGTLADEDHPPIPWGAPPSHVPFVATAAPTGNPYYAYAQQ